MKLRALEDFNNKNEYILAFQLCGGKYVPSICYPVYADNGLFFVNHHHIILPYHAFSYIETGENMFGMTNKLMIVFNDYMECQAWCNKQNRF